MKLWIMSDIHMDVGHNTHPFSLPDPRPEHDAVIIAGDIREHMVRGVRWIANNGFTKPVFYVAGNHEFYGRKLDTEIQKAKDEAAKHPHIHVLERDAVTLIDLPAITPHWTVPAEHTVVRDRIKFLGTTLWSDFNIYGLPELARMAAHGGMNDYKRIRLAKDGYRKITPSDTLTEHLLSKQWLTDELAKPFDGKVVVITHHAPSHHSVQAEFGGHALTPAYVSNLEHLVKQADLWVHGHIHQQKQYQFPDGPRAGKVVMNPRGYAHHQEGKNFDPALIIDTDAIARPTDITSCDVNHPTTAKELEHA